MKGETMMSGQAIQAVGKAPERDPATVEFQLDRLRVAVTEVRVQAINAL